eukprot:TRINITY_DN6949_c0_g1_i1.p1 TRINITY_DN6949_c0_g1~~TRINITY_DN6949_c0_g1_i1.p1  ORF type:complete len:185 (+),score=30.06 TRINITY_DN6949_c0_g1_i1:302-856(+)
MPPKQRKIAVMGFRGVGKSAITVQYVENHFPDAYNPTIENAFYKTIKYKGEEYTAEILDTAGQDEYSIFHTQYSIGIHGYVMVYSVASKSSFDLVRVLNDKILNACGTEKVPRILIGNKSDLPVENRQVSREEGQACANELGCAFIECSAKHNENVEAAFQLLIAEIEKSSNPEPEEKPNCRIL